MLDNQDICEMVWCGSGEGIIRTTHPALEGTHCGDNRVCFLLIVKYGIPFFLGAQYLYVCLMTKFVVLYVDCLNSSIVLQELGCFVHLQWCREGKCVRVGRGQKAIVTHGSWSEWNDRPGTLINLFSEQGCFDDYIDIRAYFIEK